MGDSAREPLQGDSQLVIHQMTGDWGINNPALWQLNRQATALARRVSEGVRYHWIPREENQVADSAFGRAAGFGHDAPGLRGAARWGRGGSGAG